MKLHFNDNQIKLILYCLEQQAYEFTDEDREDYNAILHSIEIAHDSTNYDF